MKRATLALTAVAALALPAAAGADSSAATCSAHGLTWNTPGQMFQAARSTYQVNPATLAGDHGLNVGQLVAAACRS